MSTGSRGGHLTGFDHEKLDAYRVATEAFSIGVASTRGVPHEDRFLRNQLLRALSSVCFNLAEGSGEFSAGDKARFFRMSRRSTSESAAIIDALAALGYVPPDVARDVKSRLSRVSVMLTRLLQSRPGTGR